MAERHQTVTVHLEYLGVDVGLWCLDCNLSTGARIWLTASTGGAMTLRATAFCTECRGHRVVDA